MFFPVLWQVECAVHNPEPHINTDSTADTPVVGHGCVWVRRFVMHNPEMKSWVSLPNLRLHARVDGGWAANWNLSAAAQSRVKCVSACVAKWSSSRLISSRWQFLTSSLWVWLLGLAQSFVHYNASAQQMVGFCCVCLKTSSWERQSGFQSYDVSTEVFSRKQTMALLTMIITANAAFALADI